MSRRVTSLSLKDKLEVLNEVKNDVDKRDLCIKYKINKSTINRIIKNEKQIRNIAVTGKNLNRKRQRNGVHGRVEKALEVWIKSLKEDDVALSQAMILDKARQLAETFNEDFNPGTSWLYRWCKRENIKIGRSYTKSVESNKVDKADEPYYTQNHLLRILEEYDSECIFNANECGLYYKAVPNLCSGKNKNVEDLGMHHARFTLLFVCNATGSFKKLYVIGKNTITGLKNLATPLPYFVNNKALLTSALWNAILGQLDTEMSASNRKIVLFVNKSCCHEITSELENINVQFLPTNSAILMQPLDIGIIKAFKVQYREQMVKRQLCAFERGLSKRQFLNSFSVLNALFLVKQTWSMIKTETIVKCFEKSGFISRERTDQTDIDKNSILKLIPNKMDYIHIDDNIKCTETINNTKMKCKKVEYLHESSIDTISEDKDPLSDNEHSDDTDDYFGQVEDDITEIEIPTANAALLALETLQNFCLFNNIESDSVEYIEKSICKNLIKETKPNAITGIF